MAAAALRMEIMQITKQLALFLDNRPGMLARICDALCDAKINIYAISSSDTVDHIVVRMVLSDPAKALFVFEEHGTLVVEDDVLMITATTNPARWPKWRTSLPTAKSTSSMLIAPRRPTPRKA
jgi:hypothetical protein